MLAKTFSATHNGIDGRVIEIEAARQKSLPCIQITGLPGDVVKESRERVRACLVNLGFDVPSARIVVHLSPAHSRKQGSQFDLGIAMSILIAEGCLEGVNVGGLAFLGEISLDGRIQRIQGSLALVEALEAKPEITTILLPKENGWEAGLIGAAKVRLVEHLGQVIDFLRGKIDLPRAESSIPRAEDLVSENVLDAVVGQGLAKRALQIALAGRHHLLFVGPPGVGKSMIAGCAPSLLPPLDSEELVEVVKNYNQSHTERPLSLRRPFRSPHHTISASAFLGGGSGTVVPGEVTLAHAGVLFLDEFPEFRRDVIEGLREPMQTGEIHLHRIGHALTLPARFTLIAAMNPCPCGHSLETSSRCTCPPDKIRAYRKRISGPILDRMDLCVVLGSPRKASHRPAALSHEELAVSIRAALEVQRRRYHGMGRRSQNGDHSVVIDSDLFQLEGVEKAWLDRLLDDGRLSFRSAAKIIKVARTIADISGQEKIGAAHLQEAWGLRCPESYAQAFGL